MTFTAPIITLGTPIETNIRPHERSAYFSLIRHNFKYLIYYRGDAKPYSKTVMQESIDGLSFSDPITIFEYTYVCHNFYVFSDRSKVIRGIGGQHAPGRTIPNTKGLYSFESDNGIQMENEQLIVSPDHSGYFDAVNEWGKLTEFDGHISCIHDDASDQYYLYIRSNPKPGARHIQYATASKFGSFGPFSPIRIDHFDEEGDSYYSPIMTKIDGVFLGFIPFVNTKYSCIRVIRSSDGINWRVVGDIFPRTPWVDHTGAPKNYDHPVNGIIDAGDVIHLYIHHNYFFADPEDKVRVSRYIVDKRQILNLD